MLYVCNAKKHEIMILNILNIHGETRKVETLKGVSGTCAVANLTGFFYYGGLKNEFQQIRIKELRLK